jgi:stearoyl-CoA desaturase (delta-9 desaturase)
MENTSSAFARTLVSSEDNFRMPLWIAPLVALMLTQVAALATSIYLHRTLAHRAIRVHPVVDGLFRAVLWLTTGQDRRQWVAVHRKHHAFTDRDGDPHSPRLLGFWRVQLLNAYYYAREASNPETLRRFAPDITPDRLDRVFFSRGWMGLGLGIAMLCGLLGPWAGLLAAGLHAVLYVGVLAPLINGLGHWRGSQNFDNTAFNSRLMAFLTGGESLHNNHHAHARSPKFSMGRWEFDPSWQLIRILVAARLAALLRPPVELPATD